MRAKNLTQENLPEYKARLAKLTARSPRRWGTLDAAGMLAHMTRVLEISLSEHHAPDISNFVTRSRPFKWLVVEIMPWPKGRLKAPEYFTPAAQENFDGEMRRLIAKMESFTAVAAKEPQRTTPSPLMGPLTMEYWAKLHGLHFEHHFKQFGI